MSIDVIGTQIDHTEQAPVVLGSEKIPTGGRGLYHVTVDQVRDYVLTYFGKDAIRLGEVDNTSDEDKPLSRATRDALSKKLNKSDPFVRSINGLTGDIDLVPTVLGLGNVDNTSDKDKPLSEVAIRSLSTKLDKVTFKDFKRVFHIFEQQVYDKFTKLDEIDTQLLNRVSQLEKTDTEIQKTLQDLTTYLNKELARVSTTLSKEQMKLVSNYVETNLDNLLDNSSWLTFRLAKLYQDVLIDINVVKTITDKLSITDDNLKNQLDSLITQLNSRFSKLNEDLSNIDSKLSANENVINRQFVEAREYFEQQINGLLPLIKGAADKYLKDLADFQQTVDGVTRNLQNSVNNVQKQIDDQNDLTSSLDWSLNSKHDALLDMMASQGKTLEELIDSASEAARKDMKDLGYRMQELDYDYDRRYQNMEGKLETQIESAKRVVKEQVERVTSDIADVKALSQELEDKAQNLADLYEDKLNEITERALADINELLEGSLSQEAIDRNQAITDAILKEAQDRADALLQETLNRSEALKEQQSQLTSLFENKLIEINGKVNEDLQVTVNSIITDVEQRVSTIATANTEILERLDNEALERLASIEQLSKDVQASVTTRIEEVTNVINEHYSELSENLITYTDTEIATYVQTLRAEAETKNQEINLKTDQLIDQFLTDSSSLRQQIKDESETRTYQLIQESQSRSNELAAAAEKQLQDLLTLENNFNSKLSFLTSSLDTKLAEKLSADVITGYYTKTEADEKSLSIVAGEINQYKASLSIGGKNLYPKTSDKWAEKTFSGWQVYLHDIQIGDNELIKAGDTITWSGEISSGNNDVCIMVHFVVPSSVESSGSIQAKSNWVLPNKTERVSGSTIVPKGATNLRLALRHNSEAAPTNTIRYRELQIEKGNVVTAWSPALADTQEAIDANSIALNSTNTEVTRIDGEVVAQGSSITQLKSNLSEVDAKTGHALTNAAVAQTTANTAVTSNAATASRVDTLESSLVLAQEGITANASALSVTNTEVSRIDGAVSSQGTSITNLTNTLESTTATANSVLTAISIKDNRSENQPPNWYWTNHPKRVVNEFKQSSVIGVTGLGTYVNLETRVYYSDSSGGPIIQTAYSANDPLLQMVRRSNGAGVTAVWTAWTQPLKTLSDTINTKANSSALNSLDSKVTDIDGKVSANATSITNLRSDLTQTNNQLGTVVDSVATAQTTANTAVTDSQANAAQLLTLNSRLSTAEGELTKKADATALNDYYTKTTADTATAGKLDQFNASLTISGANLVKGTSTAVTVNGSNKENDVKFIYSLITTSLKELCAKDQIDQTYTISFKWVATSGSKGTFYPQFNTAPWTSFNTKTVVSSTNLSGFVEISAKVTSEWLTSLATNLQIRMDGFTGSLTISEFMFQKSSKATDWQPAVIETQNALAANSSALSTLNTTVTQQGKDITSQGSNITKIQSDLTNEATRGSDLLLNGYGQLLNNTNWPNTEWIGTDKALSEVAGSFLMKTTSTIISTEKIAYDSSKTYKWSYYLKQMTPGVRSNVLGCVIPIDVLGNTIGPQHYNWQSGTTTTLAKELKPGDTTITLSSSTNWSKTGTTYSRSIIFWDYVDSSGYQWPKETYSRDFFLDAYADNAINGNVITLRSAWTGKTYPVGANLSNGASGSTWVYVGNTGSVITENWVLYEGTFGNQGSVKIPAGTAYFKLGFIPNRSATGGTSVTGVSAISLKDWSVVTDPTLATVTALNATTTEVTRIDGVVKAQGSSISKLESDLSTVDTKTGQALTNAATAQTTANTAVTESATNASQITTLQGRTTTLENNVAKKADASILNDYYTKTAADTAIAGQITSYNTSLVIGGQNIYSGPNPITLSGSLGRYTANSLQATITLSSSFAVNTLDISALKYGDPVCVSMEFMIPVTTTVDFEFIFSVYRLANSNPTSGSGYRETVRLNTANLEKGKWHKIDIPQGWYPTTATSVTNSSVRVVLYNIETGSSINWRNLMIEKSTKHSAYIESDKSIQNKLDVNSTAINTTNTEVSRVNGEVVAQGASINQLRSSINEVDTKTNTAINNAATAQTTANTGVTKAEAAASSVATLKTAYEAKVANLDSVDSKNAADIVKTNTDLTTAQTALSNADKALGGRIDTLTTTVNNNDTAVRGQISDVASSLSTLEGNTNSKFTSLESSLSGLNTTVGKKADASAVTALTTRVKNTEDVNTSQATSLTTLNSSLTKIDELSRVMNSGKLLSKDPTFKEGFNNVTVYNNQNNGNVIVTRILKNTDNPTLSTHELKVTTTGSANPNHGGFILGFSSRPNAVFLTKYIVKLPLGFTLQPAANAIGSGGTDRLYGQTTGTGKYETLYRITRCGSDGSFSSAGHISAYNPNVVASVEQPIEWYLASVELYDCTDFQSAPQSVLDSIASAQTTANSAVTGTEANASQITDLKARMTTAEGSLETKASADALSSLTTRVSNAEGVNTSQGSSITKLTADLETTNTNLNKKAEVTALNALDVKVTEVDGKVTTNASQISSLQNRASEIEGNVAKKADSTVLNEYYTKTQMEGKAAEIAAGEVTKFNASLVIGGKNLVRDSDKFLVGGGGTGLTRTILDNGSIQLTGGGNTWHTWSNSNSQNSDTSVLTIGDKFTVTLWVKAVDVTNLPTTMPSLYLMGPNPTYLNDFTVIGNVSSGSTIRYVQTRTCNKVSTILGNTHMHWPTTAVGGGIIIERWQIEIGTKSTDWTAAPEDIKQSINANTTAINTTNVEVSRVDGVVKTQGTSISKLQSDLVTVDAKAGTAITNAATAQTTANTAVTNNASTANTLSELSVSFNSAKDSGYSLIPDYYMKDPSAWRSHYGTDLKTYFTTIADGVVGPTVFRKPATVSQCWNYSKTAVPNDRAYKVSMWVRRGLNSSGLIYFTVNTIGIDGIHDSVYSSQSVSVPANNTWVQVSTIFDLVSSKATSPQLAFGFALNHSTVSDICDMQGFKVEAVLSNSDLDSSVASSAALTSAQTTLADADKALGTRIDTLTTTVANNNTAATNSMKTVSDSLADFKTATNTQLTTIDSTFKSMPSSGVNLLPMCVSNPIAMPSPGFTAGATYTFEPSTDTPTVRRWKITIPAATATNNGIYFNEGGGNTVRPVKLSKGSYIFSCYAKTELAASYRIGIQAYPTSVTTYFDLTKTLNRFSFKFDVVAETADVCILLMVNPSGLTASGSYYIERMMLERSIVAANTSPSDWVSGTSDISTRFVESNASITSLSNTVSTKDTAMGKRVDDLTTTVTNNNTTLTSKIKEVSDSVTTLDTTTNSKITALTSRLDTADNKLATKADAEALSSLDTRVTNTEAMNASQATSLNSLSSTLGEVSKTIPSKTQILDLSTLNADTYYPVTMVVSTTLRNRIIVKTALSSGSKPTWATHASGFSCQFDWEVTGSGYGGATVNRIINTAWYQYSAQPPAIGIGQLTNSSREYIFLRGGAKYNLATSANVETAVIHTESVTFTSQTVAPRTYDASLIIATMWSEKASTTALNATNTEVLRVNGLVTTQGSSINKLQSDLTALDTKTGQAITNAATAQTTANTAVNSASANASQITSLDSRLGIAEGQLGNKAEASALNSYYTKTEADNVLAGQLSNFNASLRIGNENLILKAKWKTPTFSDSYYQNGFTLVKSTSPYTVWAQYGPFTEEEFPLNTPAVFSFKIKAFDNTPLTIGGHFLGTAAVTTVAIDGVLQGNTQWSSANITIPNDSKWHIIAVFATRTSINSDFIYIQPNRGNSYSQAVNCSVKDVMLSLGNTYTEWVEPLEVVRDRIAANATAIQSTNTEITKIDGRVTANSTSINNLNSKVATVEGTLVNKADASVLSNYYTKSNANDVIAGKLETFNANLQIGGVNLLSNGDFSQGLANWEGATLSVIADSLNVFDRIVRVVSTSNSQGFKCTNTYATTQLKLIVGKTYTFSGWLRATSDATLFIALDGSAISSAQSITVSTTWKYFEVTRTVKDNMIPRVYGIAEFFVAQLQIEEGNKATSWSPNYKDTQGTITANTTAIQTTNTEVTRVNGVVTTQGTLISGLRSDLNTVDTKAGTAINNAATAQQTANTAVNANSSTATSLNTLSSKFNVSAIASSNLLINSNLELLYKADKAYPHGIYKLGEPWEVGAKYTLLWCATHTRATGDTTSSLAVYAGGGTQSVQSVNGASSKVNTITFTKSSSGVSQQLNFYLLSTPAVGVATVATIHWAVLVKGEFLTTDKWIPSSYDYIAANNETNASITTLSNTLSNADTALSNRIDTLSSTVSNNNTTVSGKINDVVSSVSTLDANTTTKFSTLESSISTIENNVAKKFDATAINDYYTKTKADEAIAGKLESFNANLIIGGTNLVTDSNNIGQSNNGSTYTISYTKGTPNSFTNVSNNGGISTYTSKFYPAVIGKVYTVSVKVKPSLDTKLSLYAVTNANGTFVAKSSEDCPANVWTTLWYTFQAKVDSVRLAGFQLTSGFTNNVVVEYKEYQAEEGNKFTSWKPATEDIQSKIDANATAINTTNTEVSRVNGLVTTQSTSISRLQSDLSTLDTKTGQAINNAATAQQTANTAVNNDKATSDRVDALTTTVSNNNTTVTGKINDVATSVTTLEGNTNSKISSLQSSLDIVSSVITISSAIDISKDLTITDTSPGEITKVTDLTATGGQVLSVGNNAGNDCVWARSTQVLTIDPNRMYRLRARLRLIAGTGYIYLGVGCLNNDKSKYVTASNTLSTNSLGSSHYLLSSARPNTGAWVTYEYFLQGKSAGAATGAGTIVDPRKFAAQAAFAAPMFIANYSSTAGTVEIDYITLEFADDLKETRTTSTALSALTTQVNTVDGNVVTLNNALTTLQGRTAVVEGDLSKKFDSTSISNYYTKSEADSVAAGAVNTFEAKLKIGATNLAKYHSSETDRPSVSVNTNTFYQEYPTGVKLQAGISYVFSITITKIEGYETVPLNVHLGVSTTETGPYVRDLGFNVNGIVSGERVVIKFTPTAAQLVHATLGDTPYLSFRIRNEKVACIWTFRQMQVEEGSIVTSWRPSTQSVQEQLDAKTVAINATNTEVNRVNGLVTTQGSSINSLTSSFESARDSDSLVADYLMKTPSQWISHYNYDLSSYFTTVTDGKISNTVFRKPSSVVACWNYSVQSVPNTRKYKLSMWVRCDANSKGACNFTARWVTPTSPNFSNTNYINVATTATVPKTNTWTYLSTIADLTSQAYTQLQFGFAIGHSTAGGLWEMQGFKVEAVLNDDDIDSAKIATKASVDSVQTTLANADSALSQRIDTLSATVGGKADASILSSYITKADSTTAIASKVDEFKSSLVIGGENLLNNSDFKGSFGSSNWASNGGGLTTVTDSVYGKVAQTALPGGIVHSWLKLDNGVSYIYSALIKMASSVTMTTGYPLHYHSGLNNTNQNKITVEEKSHITIPAGVWTRVWIKFKLTGDAESFRPFIYGGSTQTIQIAWTKLERGTVPTDWSENSTKIREHTESIDGVKSLKTISIDNNGVVAGYGLVSELVNGNVTSAFAINADQFYIGNPSNGKKPFTVLTSPGTINGVSVPAGTYIDTAYIGDATISSAKISKIDANKITVGGSTTYEPGYDPASNLQAAKDYVDVNTYNGGVVINNPLGLRNASAAVAGSFVITTPLTTSALMTQLDISGYLYTSNIETVFKITLSFYAYTSSQPFYNYRASCSGITLSDITLALDANKKVVIILSKSNTWSYPFITVDKATIGNGTASLKSGWSAAFVSDLTPYTNQTAVTIDQSETVAGSTAKVQVVANQISDIAADNKLTAVEKKSIKLIWDDIQKEYSELSARATSVSLDYATLSSSYNALNTYLTPLLANTNITSDIVRTTFENTFTSYRTAASELEKLITTWTISTAVDKVEIGGKNYALNSASGNTSKTLSPSWDLIAFAGRAVTVSFDINMTTAATSVQTGKDRIGFEFSYTDINGITRYVGAWCTGVFAKGVFKERIVNTYVLPTAPSKTAITTLPYYYQVNGGACTISNVKVELGTKATDWTAAPEDITASIDNISVGGVNLLYRSYDTSLWSTYGSPSITNVAYNYQSDETKLFSSTTYETTGGTSKLKVYRQASNLESGKLITMSAVIKNRGTTAITIDTLGVTPAQSKEIAVGLTEVIVFTGNILSTNTTVQFRINTANIADAMAVDIFNLKFEYGNKATDWAPSPRDVDLAISSKSKTFLSTPTIPYASGDIWKDGTSTRISTVTKATGSFTASDWVLVGDVTSNNTAADTAKVNGIAASTVTANAAAGKAISDNILSDLVVTPVEKTGLYNEWNRIKAEYSNLSAQASTYGVATTDLTAAYNALNTTAVAVPTVLATMTANTTFTSAQRDAFRAKFNTYYVAATALSKSVEVAISDKAQTAIDNISIGGTNLYNYSQAYAGTGWVSGSTVIDTTQTYNSFIVRKSTAQWSGPYQSISSVPIGFEVTLSFWAKRDAVGTFGVYATGATAVGTVTGIAATTTWKRYAVTFRTTAASFNLRPENSLTTGVLYTCGLQLEIGNRATDWSSSQQDLMNYADSSISNIRLGGTNLFPASLYKKGYHLSSGALSALTTTNHVTYDKFIPTGVNDTIIYQCWNDAAITSSNSNRVAFYDSAQVYLSQVTIPTLAAGTPYQTLKITIPATAAFVKLGAISGSTTYANNIRIKFEFGNNPTDWSQAPEDLQSTWETYVNNNTGNLLNNVTFSGTVDKWNTGTATNQTFQGVSVPVHTLTTSGDSQAHSDRFIVDPSKAYEVSVWLKSDQAVGSLYLGLVAQNSSGTNIGVNAISRTNPVEVSTANTNFYFHSVSGGGNPLDWVKWVGYIMPAGTPASDMKNLGSNIGTNARMLPQTNYIQVRWLNYYNGGTTTTKWAANFKCVEVDPNAISIANYANILADSKSQTFVSTPTIPYSIGDVWKEGTTVKIAVVSRTTGSYTASDWTLVGDVTASNTAADTLKVNGISAATVATNAANGATVYADVMSDLKITPVEKTAINQEWNRIQKEYASLLSQAQSLGVTTTAYTSAYTGLSTTAPAMSTILSSMTTTTTLTTAQRDAYKSQYTTYYTQAVAITKAINEKIAANAQNAVDNIQIGGTNLALNTGRETGQYTWAVTTTSPLIVGKEYTLSFDYIGNVNGSVFLNNSVNKSYPAINSTTWTRASVTFVFVKNDYQGFGIYPHVYGATNLKNLKLELGNKATEWTPAPEDVDAAIQSKSKTFISTPTVPYSIGDLWRDVNTVKVCTFARLTGAYTASDWTLAGDITSLNTSANTAKVGNTLAATIESNSLAGANISADILSDLIITPVEKTALYNEWNRIKAEYTNQLAQASSLSVVTTAYTTAYNAIDSTAPRISTILASMSTKTTLTVAERDNFRAQLNTYYTQATGIAKAITQAVIDKASAEVTVVSNNLSTVLSTVNDMSADNVLTPLEKQQSKTIWDSIANSHSNLLAQATTAGVSSTAYTSAYNALSTYLNGLFSNMKASSTIVRTTFNTNFATLYTQKSALEKAINDASFTIGGENLLDNTSFTENITGWASSGGTNTIVSQTVGNGATKCLSIVATGASQGIYRSLNNRYTATSATVTVSFWAKASAAGLTLKVASENHTGTSTVTLTTAWQYYSLTLTKTTANPNIVIYSGAAGTFYVSQLKYEKGAVATSWSPSTFELDASISSATEAASSANTAATAASNTVNGWKTPNTTTIDGAKITTGSITATQLSVQSLSALNAKIGTITTTGTQGSMTISDSLIEIRDASGNIRVRLGIW